MDNFIEYLLLFIRVFLPILSIIIVFLAFRSMKSSQRGNRPLIILENKLTKEKIPVVFWENSIGRKRSSDIRLNDNTVSREHAVLFRRKKGWIISDSNSKAGIIVNGKKISDDTQVYLDDTISIGAVPFTLKKYEESSNTLNAKPSRLKKNPIKPSVLLLIVSCFHFFMFAQQLLFDLNFSFVKFVPFLLILIVSWGFFFISASIFKRVSFELETIALFLCGIGIILIGNYKLSKVYSQVISLVIGIFLYFFILWFIEKLDLVMKFRGTITILAVILFLVNIFFAKSINGSKNWIIIGPLSIQISEFIKIAYVFVGASTLDKLKTTKNLTGFIIFSSFCIGSLFLIKDFGTACIFFVAFLIISFMRSGSIRTLILSLSAAAIGSFIILTFKPYIKDRFAVWGHVFEHTQSTGFQQSRVLTYSASGGLFGVGVGKGYLKNIFAGTSDLMFGVVCEELGLIIALVIALSIAFLAFFARKESIKSRSTFYVISACAAAGILVFGASLNIFGATDILPLTGVTLPFVSLGGSSIISSFGLLAFIKAADERTFALKRN